MNKLLTDRYRDLRRAAALMNETKDCAVMAVAVLGDLPYDEAHCLLEMHGRVNRSGTHNYKTRNALTFLDLETEVQTRMWQALGGRTVRTLGRLMKGIKGMYLVGTAHHVFAVKDGEIHDWTKGRLHRITRVEKVTPMAMAANNEDKR